MANTNKYKFWMATIRESDPKVEYSNLGSQDVGDALAKVCDDFCFQLEECPTSGNRHFQCCLKLLIRKRHSTLLNDLVHHLCCESSQVQIQKMEGTWEQAVAYCSKEDTRTRPEREPFRLKKPEPKYEGSDINFLNNYDKRHPWQNILFSKIFDDIPNTIKATDDRSIIWIEDSHGNTGKSKFVKYCCYYNNNCTKISFGSASQLRSGLINCGTKKVYFIDIPRTLGVDDSMNNIISAVEDLKNGFLTSNFYGNSSHLMMDPPHIIVFSNMKCPMEKLSSDRWENLTIIGNTMHKRNYDNTFTPIE